MRDMQVVAEQHLQRVLTGFEGDFCRRAAVTEVNMLVVLGNRETEVGQASINQQVMVAGVRLVLAGRHDVHACHAKLGPEPGC